MTEFGGAFFSPNASNPTGRASEEMSCLLEEADSRLQSWTFWDLAHFYDYPEPAPGCRDDEPNCDSLTLMSRPYAQAIAGKPTEMHFDVDSREFVLNFDANTSIDADTEIFLPPHVYNGGYIVDTSVSWGVCEGRANIICVQTFGGKDGAAIKVTVSQK